ncbi:membrane protein [Alkalihalobacillus alcalophilus ATCC 27647 = CGMCC 1.3604]|uniref:Membrane protein n=1 Tax=Alkalihalobacillus alcalophilus ATCC 27647 = CGMCC 1.3604 TaxID=1218173 RepID=A0A094XJJ6_ALKAL|nr:DUF4260 domain-containing protein [Alkalihalobacillus alcalophilus]KGA98940.1 membrane protein [Alkalihalobacillus alcalophilus ATCC 27647 = CGMCC 1.3604]MED1561972.1 DUF4260 domain-containing protein [Alkalihalobacillus alcalophilus]THG90339.1 membrane protein [Alkalihalobacillus alcalophilus ATCC 27647 = CGMCC 1.3604]
MSLQSLIRIEYAVAFLLCLFLYIYLDYSLFLFALFLLLPDVTMIGYFINNQFGARLYNVGHSFIIPMICIIFALSMGVSSLLMVALIWFAHICMDRALGFGLKYTEHFRETHIQKIV